MKRKVKKERDGEEGSLLQLYIPASNVVSKHRNVPSFQKKKKSPSLLCRGF